MPKPPYREARLVNGDKPLTERWYIIFYAWHAQKEQLVKKRDYRINQYKTKSERLNYARKTIAKINGLLEQGAHVNESKKRDEAKAIYIDRERDYTIDQAFKFILPIVASTKRKATYNSYNSVASLFLEFCDDAGWTHWKIRTLNRNDLIAWLDYLQSGVGERPPVGNNTRNKYLSYISAMFTMMQERNVLKENIGKGIKMLAVDVGGNTAYTPDEVRTLKEAILKKEPQLWLFVTFLLYGFIRPAEIGRLRVKMIDLGANRIYLPGTITKNRKPRAVTISPPFRAYIDQLNLPLYRPDDFVFGFNLVTGPHQIQFNYASATHRSIARDKGFGSGYTLYSWKHTGVVLHYRAGIDVKTLQAQIGHQSLHETDIYLKSLNLYENREIEDKSPSI